MWLFYYFNFERKYDVFKSKCPCILLKHNINFDKNDIESKEENPKQSFRETNLVLQLIQESLNWSSRKKKEGIFCTVHFIQNVFNIRVLSQCICIFQNIHTFTY